MLYQLYRLWTYLKTPTFTFIDMNDWKFPLFVHGKSEKQGDFFNLQIIVCVLKIDLNISGYIDTITFDTYETCPS